MTLEEARAHGIRLLKFRPRSEAELRQRLLRKGFSQAVVDSLVEEFGRKGFLNDAKFAQYFATQQMMVKPSGRRALLMGLKAKGVDPQLATQAVEAASGGRDELEVAREVASARFSHLQGVTPEAAKRRLFGFLSRRGFSSDVIYKVVREVSVHRSVSDEKL